MRDRGPLGSFILVAIGIGIVIVAAALIGARDKSNETVTAGEWSQSVCGAVGAWRGELEAIVEDIRTPGASGDTGTEEPQSETPQGRTGFIRAGLERAVQATETMVVGIENAGTPDTPQGEAAAQVVSDWASSHAGRSRGCAGLARQRGRHARGVDRPADRRRAVARRRPHRRCAGARRGGANRP